MANENKAPEGKDSSDLAGRVASGDHDFIKNGNEVYENHGNGSIARVVITGKEGADFVGDASVPPFVERSQKLGEDIENLGRKNPQTSELGTNQNISSTGSAALGNFDEVSKDSRAQKVSYTGTPSSVFEQIRGSIQSDKTSEILSKDDRGSIAKPDQRSLMEATNKMIDDKDKHKVITTAAEKALKGTGIVEQQRNARIASEKESKPISENISEETIIAKEEVAGSTQQKPDIKDEKETKNEADERITQILKTQESVLENLRALSERYKEDKEARQIIYNIFANTSELTKNLTDNSTVFKNSFNSEMKTSSEEVNIKKSFNDRPSTETVEEGQNNQTAGSTAIPVVEGQIVSEQPEAVNPVPNQVITVEQSNQNQEQLAKERKWQKVALIAGVVGGATTGLLGGTAIAGSAALISLGVGAGNNLLRFIGEKRQIKLTEKIASATTQAEKDKLQKRYDRWSKVLNATKYVSKFVKGFGYGLLASTFVSKVFMGGEGLIDKLRPDVTPNIVAGKANIGQPNPQNPHLGQGSNISAGAGSSSATEVAKNFDTGLIQNGRINLPGSAWNGNMAGGPTGTLPGGETLYSNYAGGQFNMAAFQFNKDLAQAGLKVTDLTEKMGTGGVHRLLNGYLNAIREGSTNPDLLTVLKDTNLAGSSDVINMLS